MNENKTQSMAKKPVRSKRRIWLLRLMTVTTSLMIALLLGEFTIRLMGEEDADGNFFFRGEHIGAYHPQVEWVRGKINEYRESDKTRMIYNPQTGWSPRPSSSSHGGMYRYNSLGIRSAPREYSKQPKPGVLRIALFGDSFTHGDDVFFEKTWGNMLEKKLNEQGVRAEVINFGVSAYGMDQAFLRWKRIGRQFAPHIVLFGFQAENVNRNVNLLRGFMMLNTGIPFSKPRFLLNENGRLKAINVPTLPIETVPDVMADMQNWEYAPYEWFYDPESYPRRFWHVSKLASLIMHRIQGDVRGATTNRPPIFSLDGEPAKVTRQLLREFQEDVEQQGGKFLIVHLPKKSDLTRSIGGKPLHYEKLLQKIEGEQTVIDPFNRLFDDARQKSLEKLFVEKKRHYSARGNRIIAETIAKHLVKKRRN
ncbi:MAG: hypothetical protein Tsb009_22940 [Planctomycetaceae bacterium]